MLAAIDLAITSVVFAVFGGWALLNPRSAAGELGLQFASSDGAIAVRAMYGGYLIGAALLFGYLSVDPNRRTYGLIAILLIVGPILISRSLGMWVEGTVTIPHLYRAGLEVASIVVTSSLLLRARLN